MRDRRSITIALPIWIVLLFALILFRQDSLAFAPATALTPTPDHPLDDDLEAKNPKEDRYRPMGASVMPLASGGPDLFGYTWNDNQAFSWIDTTSGVLLDLTGDDKVSNPIPIGFNFPFYENTYSELFVTTNGLITFGEPTYSFNNREMPFIIEPQNLIAPFWDDLHVSTSTGGKIYYHSNADRMVVSWQNVARYPNTSDLMTFQAVLYKNGNICYQYKTLNGILNLATVGIEDSTGSDGLTYLHKASGLDLIEGLKQVCFTRPSPSYRVKLLPRYQGGLVIDDYEGFNLEIANTGDLGPDSFELLAVASDPSWNLRLTRTSGEVLPDNDHDGRFETGVIQAGQSLSLLVKLYPPKGANIGANTTVDITATSQKQPSAQSIAKLHGAVPSPFVQGVVVGDAKSLLMVWSENVYRPLISSNYTGSTIGVNYLPGDRYFYYWEQNDTYTDGNDRSINFTDIEFSLLNGVGHPIYGPSKLTSNQAKSTYTNKVTDRSPVAAATDDGKIGIAWVRYIDNGQTWQRQANVFFAIYELNNMSDPLVGPINVTQNSDWSGSGVTDVPVYYSPRIAYTNDNRFVLTWSDSRKQTGGDTEGIGFAAYTPTGQKTAYKENVPGLVSIPGTLLFRSPNITGTTDGRVFLSFVNENISTDTSSIGYLVLDSNGNTVKATYIIPGIQGLTPATLQFSTGPILLAWLNPDSSQGTQQATFVTINPSTYDITNGPIELVTPNALSADLISVSQEIYGNAVISWMEMDIEQSIFYALVRNDGTVITPPVKIFDSNGKTITISKVRAGNAAYIGKQRVYLPLSQR